MAATTAGEAFNRRAKPWLELIGPIRGSLADGSRPLWGAPKILERVCPLLRVLTSRHTCSVAGQPLHFARGSHGNPASFSRLLETADSLLIPRWTPVSFG
jgi:hypothetical protein